MLNQECVRDILLFIENNQTFHSDGVPQTFKFKSFCEDPEMSQKYTMADMNTAVVYLCQKSFLESVNFIAKTKHIQIKRITAKGYDYLQVIKDSSLWKKLCAKFGENFFSTSTTVAVEAAMKVLFKFLN